MRRRLPDVGGELTSGFGETIRVAEVARGTLRLDARRFIYSTR